MKLEAEASLLWGRSKEDRLIAKDIIESIPLNDPNKKTREYGLVVLKGPDPNFDVVNKMLKDRYGDNLENNIDNNIDNNIIIENKYTDKKIVNEKIEELSIEEIMNNKDNNIEFKHNFPPSNTIHLTRLAKNITEFDLIKIYNRFQTNIQNPIQYKLFHKGKLRNQAFIKFESTEIATKALKLSEGYILNGKPLIIDYGKGN